MAKKKAAAAPAEKVALHKKLVATNPKVERTAVNGNMFSLLTPRGT